MANTAIAKCFLKPYMEFLLFEQPAHQVAVGRSFTMNLDVEPTLLQRIDLFSELSEIFGAGDVSSIVNDSLGGLGKSPALFNVLGS